MASRQGLDYFEQTVGAYFIGIAQAVTVALLLSALTIVGKGFGATDPPAASAFGNIIIPYKRLLADAGWYAYVLRIVAHGVSHRSIRRWPQDFTRPRNPKYVLFRDAVIRPWQGKEGYFSHWVSRGVPRPPPCPAVLPVIPSRFDRLPFQVGMGAHPEHFQGQSFPVSKSQKSGKTSLSSAS